MTDPTAPGELAQRAERFMALHTPGAPLLMPNAWDIGSAALFAALGFAAIATTSGGFAATRGRLDGAMTKDEVLTHSGELAGAVAIPVSGDLENCFAHDPDGVAATNTAAIDVGLAGGSVEDFTGDRDAPIYELAQAAERVAAAAAAAHAGPVPFVLTARAENYLHGRKDLADTIARLQAYQEAGADVLFAPRVVDPVDLRQLLSSVDRPVSVLVLPGCPTVGELGQLGVSRISVGGAIAVAAYGAAINAVTELRDKGTTSYWDLAAVARPVIGDAFSR
jgi:2-methylisocitrate lyase-like PEP mutase family enzyme